jgi:hypothetical protein
MTDLTLNDFSGIPESQIRKILQHEADKICQNDLTREECLKNDHGSSFISKSLKRYRPKSPLPFTRS